MAEFFKHFNNTLIWAITLLGILAIFYKKLDLITGLLSLSLLLFIGFISLIIYYIAKLDGKIERLEERYKRADDLEDIKLNIKMIKQKLRIK